MAQVMIPGGQLLRYLREAKGVTRRRLVELSGVQLSKVRAFENGLKAGLPSEAEAKALFAALGEAEQGE